MRLSAWTLDRVAAALRLGKLPEQAPCFLQFLGVFPYEIARGALCCQSNKFPNIASAWEVVPSK